VFGVYIAQVALGSLERGAEPKHAPCSFGAHVAQLALGILGVVLRSGRVSDNMAVILKKWFGTSEV